MPVVLPKSGSVVASRLSALLPSIFCAYFVYATFVILSGTVRSTRGKPLGMPGLSHTFFDGNSRIALIRMNYATENPMPAKTLCRNCCYLDKFYLCAV